MAGTDYSTICEAVARKPWGEPSHLDIDQRLAFLSRAAALDKLVHLGEIGINEAFGWLTSALIEIVFPRPENLACAT
jgi:hypothetical protein